MGILSAIQEKVGGVMFGETIKDYGVIASDSHWSGKSTFSAFLARKGGTPVLWLKINQRSGASSRTNYVDLSREAVQQFAEVFRDALDSM